MSGIESRRYFAACPKGLEYLLVDDSHRLADHVDYGARAFARFLEQLT